MIISLFIDLGGSSPNKFYAIFFYCPIVKFFIPLSKCPYIYVEYCTFDLGMMLFYKYCLFYRIHTADAGAVWHTLMDISTSNTLNKCDLLRNFMIVCPINFTTRESRRIDQTLELQASYDVWIYLVSVFFYL